MNVQSVLIKPVITEKSMLEAESGKFTFVVAKSATKTDIKNALQAVFKVTPVSVATSVVKGKRKRVGKKRVEVANSVWKKAMITLKKGENISLFETGSQKEEEKKEKKKK